MKISVESKCKQTTTVHIQDLYRSNKMNDHESKRLYSLWREDKTVSTSELELPLPLAVLRKKFTSFKISVESKCKKHNQITILYIIRSHQSMR